jgi:phosphohistidine phosphatase SixA
MKNCFLLLLLISLSIFITSCSYKVYVVRHAEKSTAPANNPLLSDIGSERAIDLKESLKNKHIKKIYSTNTTRTLSTAAPLGLVMNIHTETYPSMPDSGFIRTLKLNATNQLVVGHSNTVDDIVNMLAGRKVIAGDLTDAEYDNLYVLTLPKSGKGKVRFANKKYGKPSQPSAGSATMMK